MMSLRALVGAVALVGSLIPVADGQSATTSSAAATPASSGLEEVVVTATRREERLQDVPISISAFSQEKLDSQGLTNIDDLARLASGIEFSRNGMGSSANYNDENSDINIRGIDSTAGTATVGVYIDDSPIQSRHIGFGSMNVYPALFDLDRIEVLRGPQGTLFGAGAEGGVVRFITPAPSLEKMGGYGRVELSTTEGGDPSYAVGAAIGGPIKEGVLGFRVSASYRRDGGWVDRVSYTRNGATDPLTPPVYTGTTESAANWQQTTTFRAALAWKASDSITVTPSFYYQRLQINDTAAYWVDLSNPGSGTYRNGNALRNPSTDPYWLGALKVDWDVGFAHLVSNTSYMSRDQSSTSDYSQYLRATWTLFGLLPSTYPPPGASGYAPFGDVQRNFYQEFRLASKADMAAPFSWNLGVYYSHLNENIPEDIIDPTLDAEVRAFTGNQYSVCVPGDPALDCPGGLIYTGQTDRMIDRQLAVFGELSWNITDTFKTIVGLRYSHLDYTGTFIGSGPFLGTAISSQSSASERPLTPKVVLQWHPNRDQMVYASAAKGFRPGGVNVGVGDICNNDLIALGLPQVPGTSTDQRQVPVQYASDSLWSYELGTKNIILAHRLQLNASVFYIDWNDIQQNVYLPSCGEQFAANLGKARSTGGDLEIVYRPIDALTLDLTAAYTDTYYTKASCAGVLTYTGAGLGCNGTDPNSGNPISAAPIVSQGNALYGAPWSFTAAVEYHMGFWQEQHPYARLDYQHSTAQTTLLSGQDPRNALYDTTIPGLPAVSNVTLHAGLRFNGYDLALFGDNLTNSHPVLFKSRDIAVDSVDQLYFGRGVRPRTIGVTASYRY